MFQFYNLVANLTVEENILLSIELSGRKIGDYMGKVTDLLELTGLKAKRNTILRSFPAVSSKDVR